MAKLKIYKCRALRAQMHGTNPGFYLQNCLTVFTILFPVARLFVLGFGFEMSRTEIQHISSSRTSPFLDSVSSGCQDLRRPDN